MARATAEGRDGRILMSDLPEGSCLAGHDLGATLSLSSTAPTRSASPPPTGSQLPPWLRTMSSSSAGEPRSSSSTMLCDRRTEPCRSSCAPPIDAIGSSSSFFLWVSRHATSWLACHPATKMEIDKRQAEGGGEKMENDHHDAGVPVKGCRFRCLERSAMSPERISQQLRMDDSFTGLALLLESACMPFLAFLLPALNGSGVARRSSPRNPPLCTSAPSAILILERDMRTVAAMEARD
jgi:hypothetical protein